MAISIESPYVDSPGALWLKGNLHCHSTRSDGALAPQETVDRFKALGYDFLMLSDHDTLGEPEKLEGDRMLLIRGYEVTAGGFHMLHVGASRRLEPCPDRQQVVDAINADGGIPIVCHPNWQEHFNHVPFEQLMALENYAGIEIANGTCLRLPGSGFATDKWDRMLGNGRRIWGYGNDDTHRTHEYGLAWTVVRARERTVQAVLDALRNGSCYVSTGVEIQEITCTGSMLHVFAPTAQGMAVFGQFGGRLHYQLGNEIYFDVKDYQGSYVRVECYGRAAEMAWTQPFYIHGGLADHFHQLGQTKPELKAARTASAVNSSGRMDDPAWNKAPESTRFLDMKDGQPPEVSTSVRCVVTKDHLVVGIRCQEPKMDQLQAAVTADGDPNTWNDDSVEVFIDAGATGKAYLHVMTSVTGHGHTMWMPDGQPGPAVRMATSRDATGWTAEIAIPLSAFDAKADGSQPWGLHVCRNRRPVRGTYFWAWVNGDNHQPKRFGRLVF